MAMTDVAELRKRLKSVEGMREKLSLRRWQLILDIEIAEGRPDSREAKFARAAVTGDLATMDEHCAQNTAQRYRETGKWCVDQERAEQIIASTAARKE